MVMKIFEQLPYFFCCVMSYAGLDGGPLSQKIPSSSIGSDVCQCIEEAQAGEMRFSGDREVYLVQFEGTRNPFGKAASKPKQTDQDISGSMPADGGSMSGNQMIIAPDEPPLTRYPAQSYLIKGVIVSARGSVAVIAPPEIADSSATDFGEEEEGFGDQGFDNQDSFSAGGVGATSSVTEAYVVQIGDVLGNNAGEIVSIALNGLTIREGKNKVIVPLSR